MAAATIGSSSSSVGVMARRVRNRHSTPLTTCR